MSRLNAVPEALRVQDAHAPTPFNTTEFPSDDYEKHLTARSFDMGDMLEALREFHDAEEAVDRLHYAIRPVNEQSLFSSESATQTAGISQGELRFRRVMRVADDVQAAQPPPEERGIWLQPAQRRGVRADLLACARFFYGGDWESGKAKFMRQYGLSKHYVWRFASHFELALSRSLTWSFCVLVQLRCRKWLCLSRRCLCLRGASFVFLCCRYPGNACLSARRNLADTV